jgi:hypothetical protein
VASVSVWKLPNALSGLAGKSKVKAGVLDTTRMPNLRLGGGVVGSMVIPSSASDSDTSQIRCGAAELGEAPKPTRTVDSSTCELEAGKVLLGPAITHRPSRVVSPGHGLYITSRLTVTAPLASLSITSQK